MTSPRITLQFSCEMPLPGPDITGDISDLSQGLKNLGNDILEVYPAAGVKIQLWARSADGSLADIFDVMNKEATF